MKYFKWIVLPLVSLSLLGGLLVGVVRFGLPESETTVQDLTGPWRYETDMGQTGELFLPWDMGVPLGTGQVRLTMKLPEWEGEGYALHFSSMVQAVEVKVGGETCYTYGASVDDRDFVYRAASHINRVPLRMTDSGKELTIIYSAPPLFRIELGLMREVWFGTESDLVLRQLLISLPFMLVAVFAFLSVLSTLLMLATYPGASLRANICTLLLTVIVIIPFTVELAILWPAFHHAPELSILYDWGFYFFDALVAPVAWLTMYAAGWNFRGWRGKAAHLYGYVFVLAVVLSLLGFFNFNLTRLLFMPLGILLTTCLLVEQKKHGCVVGQFGLALSALVLLAGYYLDYLKYCLMFLSRSRKWSAFLQLKLPFQFFTSIALVVFSMLALRATMSELANRQAAVREEMYKQKSDAEFLHLSATSMVERLRLMDESVQRQRIAAHDCRHFNNIVLELLEQGQSAEAVAILHQQAEYKLPTDKSYCKNIAVNAAVCYYVEWAEAKGIATDISLEIPNELYVDSLEFAMALSNLLENAIHGCDRLPKGIKKQIRFTCRHVGQLMLEILNPCTGDTTLNENGYPTSRKEGHGLGIKSVLTFAEKYNGELFYHIENGVFTARLFIDGNSPSG